MPSKKNVKSNTRKRARNTKVNDGIDVSTEADIGKLMDLLKKHPVVVVMIHADWCGHCQTFKPMWEDYKKIPGRTVPMASINEKMLAKTKFKDAKIDGFPSTVVYSGKDGSFGSFKNEQGEETNSIPNIRDKQAMTTLLKAKPSMLRRVNSNSPDSESAQSTPEAEALLEESGKRAIKNKNTPINDLNEVAPPNVNNDSISNRRGTKKRKARG
jgi:thiol-disulfide isomerase/thioredoxin